MRRRRSVEVFSLSFLDCICCGFGAIILLLVLTEIGRPAVLEKSRKNLDDQIRNLSQRLYAIQGETDDHRCCRDVAAARPCPADPTGVAVARVHGRLHRRALCL